MNQITERRGKTHRCGPRGGEKSAIGEGDGGGEDEDGKEERNGEKEYGGERVKP